MTPHFVTVYQISADQAYSSFADLAKLVPAAFGVFFLACGLLILVAKARFTRRPLHWLTAISLCVLGAFFLCVLTPRILRRDSDAMTAYQKGNYEVAEGLVTDFDPMPYEGHKKECFSVNNTRFCYSDYMAGPGFRNTASHGGPINSGLHVRIAFLPTAQRNVILRLEVARDQATPLH